MRAEAYRSMADERGQLCHVQAAVCQVLVDGDLPWRRRENAFLRRCSPVTWSRLTDGGSIYRNLQFAKSEYGVRLMNTFFLRL